MNCITEFRAINCRVVKVGCAETYINMANSVAPDSWEQQADSADTTADSPFVEGKFSTLNVNAAEFVPSFCINSVSQSDVTARPTNVNTPSTIVATNDTPTGDFNVFDVATTTFVPPETHHGTPFIIYLFYLTYLSIIFIKYIACSFL